MVNAAIKESEESFEVEDTAEPIPPTDIVAYNELRSCADLVRLHKTGKLEIKPDFQREVVWKPADQTRFIDSLVKQLPIPSMCFSLDYRTQKWKVIDGLQRMSSIIAFLSAPTMRLVDLPDIQPRLRASSNEMLRSGDDDQKRLYAMVEDFSIPVTVIRCDYSQQSHMRYLFTIFHRLNSGGVRLTNQEIRNCIFTGPFNNALKAFDKDNKHWKAVAKRIWGSMDRFRSIEVLLRVAAFSENLAAYDGNLAGFLNEYMQAHANDSGEVLESLMSRLTITAKLASEVLANETRKKLPLALIEALLVGILLNLPRLRDRSVNQLRHVYQDLLNDNVFADSARYAVSSPENVTMRIQLAEALFDIG